VNSPGIFLLYEGLPPTIIESQVLAHAAAMAREGVAMEVWSFAVTAADYAAAQARLPRLAEHGVDIQLRRALRPALPGSALLNALWLAWCLRRRGLRPAFIHARTDYSAAVAARLRDWLRIPLVWDARGDTEAEFELTVRAWPRWKQWLAPLKRAAVHRHVARAARSADRALFVSAALRAVQAPQLAADKVRVVPCLADAALFFFSPELRAASRARLGYGCGDVVLVYVGSLAAWQCVDQTVALMQQAMARHPQCRALVVTPEPERFRALFGTADAARVTVVSAGLREVNGYLNAADYGILLREMSPINRVASPVKHAEYCLAGLTLIATEAVDQVVDIGARLHNLLPCDDACIERLAAARSDAERAALAEQARGLLSRTGMAASLAALYKELG
jgi:hypothetical protein